MKKITILYVEDEENIRNELVEILELDFDTVLTCNNGEEGLALYKEHHPDLVISDVQMPKMDGLQMYQEILSIDKDAKIILTTAFNEGHYLHEAHELDIRSYITKPIDIKQLYSAIDETLKGTQEKNDEN